MEDLATELLADIFMSCSSLEDAVHLASTCRHMRNVFNARKVEIFTRAAEAQYGPLPDAIQLVTHNASQPAHILRNVPVSIALIKQIVQVGRAAKRWAELYPFKKWKDDFENRRLLSDAEHYVFRRALYRIWLYNRAFHNAAHPRYQRLARPVILERAELLHNWNNAELAEIADVRQILRDVLRTNVCPSNGTVQRKFRKRFPETNYQLQFNMHLNYPPPSHTTFLQQQVQQHLAANYHQHQPLATVPTFDKYYAKYRPTPLYEPGGEGWGDDIEHYYVVEDMMKLDPGQILWLRDNCATKSQVESYVKGLGDWFFNNGETFGQTLEFVLSERGAEVDLFMDEIEDGEKGVACF